MGKDLSARLLSTLKDLASVSASAKYVLAVWKMASLDFSQGRARVMAMMPNTCLQAVYAPAMSQVPSAGST